MARYDFSVVVQLKQKRRGSKGKFIYSFKRASHQLPIIDQETFVPSLDFVNGGRI